MIFLNKTLHDPSSSLQTNAKTPTRCFLERLPRLLRLPSRTEKNSASKPIICRCRVVCVSAGVDTCGGGGSKVVEEEVVRCRVEGGRSVQGGRGSTLEGGGTRRSLDGGTYNG